MGKWFCKYIRLLVLLKTYLKLNLNVTIRSIDTETGLFVPIPTSKVREKNKVLFLLLVRHIVRLILISLV